MEGRKAFRGVKDIGDGKEQWIGEEIDTFGEAIQAMSATSKAFTDPQLKVGANLMKEYFKGMPDDFEKIITIQDGDKEKTIKVTKDNLDSVVDQAKENGNLEKLIRATGKEEISMANQIKKQRVARIRQLKLQNIMIDLQTKQNDAMRSINTELKGFKESFAFDKVVLGEDYRGAGRVGAEMDQRRAQLRSTFEQKQLKAQTTTQQKLVDVISKDKTLSGKVKELAQGGAKTELQAAGLWKSWDKYNQATKGDKDQNFEKYFASLDVDKAVTFLNTLAESSAGSDEKTKVEIGSLVKQLRASMGGARKDLEAEEGLLKSVEKRMLYEEKIKEIKLDQNRFSELLASGNELKSARERHRLEKDILDMKIKAVDAGFLTGEEKISMMIAEKNRQLVTKQDETKRASTSKITGLLGRSELESLYSDLPGLQERMLSKMERGETRQAVDLLGQARGRHVSQTDDQRRFYGKFQSVSGNIWRDPARAKEPSGGPWMQPEPPSPQTPSGGHPTREDSERVIGKAKGSKMEPFDAAHEANYATFLRVNKRMQQFDKNVRQKRLDDLAKMEKAHPWLGGNPYAAQPPSGMDPKVQRRLKKAHAELQLQYEATAGPNQARDPKATSLGVQSPYMTGDIQDVMLTRQGYQHSDAAQQRAMESAALNIEQQSGKEWKVEFEKVLEEENVVMKNRVDSMDHVALLIDNELKQTDAVLKSNKEIVNAEIELAVRKRKRLTDEKAFMAGFTDSVKEMHEATRTFNYEFGKQMAVGLRDGIAAAMGAAMDKTKDLGDALRNIATGFLKTMQDALLKNAADLMMKKMFGGFANYLDPSNFNAAAMTIQASNSALVATTAANTSATILNTSAIVSSSSRGIINSGQNIIGSNPYGSKGWLGRSDSGLPKSGRSPPTTPGLNSGGLVSSRVSNGEYLMSGGAVRKYGGGFMGSLNSGRVPGFANGGAPGSALAANFGGGESYTSGRLYQGKAMSGSFYAGDNIGLSEDAQEAKRIIDERERAKAEKKAKKKAFWSSVLSTALSFGFSYGMSGGFGPQGDVPSGKGPGAVREGGFMGWIKNLFSPGGEKLGGKRGPAGPAGQQHGGMIQGTPGVDQIPAMLSEGEYVIKSSSVRQLGKSTLDRINAGKFADGGPTTPISEQAESTVTGGNTNNINISINLEKGGKEKTQGETGANPADATDDAEKQKALGEKIKAQVVNVIREEQRPGGLLD